MNVSKVKGLSKGFINKIGQQKDNKRTTTTNKVKVSYQIFLKTKIANSIKNKTRSRIYKSLQETVMDITPVAVVVFHNSPVNQLVYCSLTPVIPCE